MKKLIMLVMLFLVGCSSTPKYKQGDCLYELSSRTSFMVIAVSEQVYLVETIDNKSLEFIKIQRADKGLIQVDCVLALEASSQW